MRTLILLLCLCSAAAANEYEILVDRVIDADTVVGRIQMDWGVAWYGSIRSDFDAWERTRVRRTVVVTDQELIKGEAATEALRGLLSRGGRLFITPPPRSRMGVYGRPVGSWRIETRGGRSIDVAAWMKARGFLRN